MNKRSFLTGLSLTALSLGSEAVASGWQPDGLGYRARIGLLTPNDDAVPESEFWAMAPEGVSIHVGRVLLVDTRTFSDPPHPDDAIALLAALPMQAIVFAFTTTSYILGSEGGAGSEGPTRETVKWESGAIDCPAAVAAFRTLGVGRIALIHPPWFADDDQQLGVTYFRDQGFDVAYANQMRLRGLPVTKPTDRLRKFNRDVSRGGLRMGTHAGAGRTGAA